MKQIGSGMPQMHAAFSGWIANVRLAKRTQSVDGFGNVTDQDIYISFRGTIQPLSPRQIALKPEGQRSWTWLQIHCLATSLDLRPNDRISWNGAIYKVMALLDYSLNGFIEYHLVRDFQTGGS